MASTPMWAASATWPLAGTREGSFPNKGIRRQNVDSAFAHSFRVPLYYFDIETEGQDPQSDRVITIQFQQLSEDLRPLGSLQVLTEWDWGEREILRSVLGRGVLDVTWDFVPVGNRLRFDLTFLMERGQHHKVREVSPSEVRRFWFDKPMLDLGPVLVLMNAGRFDGSGIANFADKGASAEVPLLYRQGKHADILAYIQNERDVTLALLAEVRAMLTTFGERKRKREPRG